MNYQKLETLIKIINYLICGSDIIPSDYITELINCLPRGYTIGSDLQLQPHEVNIERFMKGKSYPILVFLSKSPIKMSEYGPIVRTYNYQEVNTMDFLGTREVDLGMNLRVDEHYYIKKNGENIDGTLGDIAAENHYNEFVVNNKHDPLRTIRSCIFHGNANIAYYIIKNSLIDLDIEGRDLLREAVIRNQIIITKFLLKYGAKLKSYARELLFLAANYGHTDMFKLLVKKGASYEGIEEKLLIASIKKDRYYFIMDMINPNRVNGPTFKVDLNNPSIIEETVRSNRLDIIKLLISHGMNLNTKAVKKLVRVSGSYNCQYFMKHEFKPFSVNEWLNLMNSCK